MRTSSASSCTGSNSAASWPTGWPRPRTCCGAPAGSPRGTPGGEPGDDYLTAHAELAPFAGRDRSGPAHHYLVPFASLPEEVREENRAVVRDIPNKLASAGYVMRHARGAVSEWSLLGRDIDRLAEAEHERWMRRRLGAGWRFGETASDPDKVHPSIVPWSKLSDDDRRDRYGPLADKVGDAELSEAEKDKDRDIVRAIPDILRMAGFTVEPLRPRTAADG